MNYLSPLQFRVLKYSAVPGLLMLYYFFVLTQQYPPSTDMGQFLNAGFMTLIIGWEFLVRKEFRKAGIFAISAAAMYFLVLLACNRMHLETSSGFFNPYYQLYTFLTFLGLLLIRGFLLKDRFALKTGLITILLWYYGTNDLRGLAFIVEAAVQMASDGPSPAYIFIGKFIQGTYQFLLPCIYYIILYFTENYLNNTDSFRQKIRSKILVMSSGEYVFFYSMLFMLLMGSSAGLGELTEAWAIIRYGGEIYAISIIIVLFHTLCLMLTIVLSGYLLRNIMVARSLTIGLHNGFLYYLHCLPFLNLVPVLIYGTRIAIHSTPSENAMAYIRRGDSQIANWIIVLGIIFSLFGLYQGYQIYQNINYYSNSSLFKILVVAVTAVQFIRLINYLRLRNSRQAVYVLFTINLLSICILLFGSIEFVVLRIGICYLSLYLLLEIFHPALFGEDAALVPASAYAEE